MLLVYILLSLLDQTIIETKKIVALACVAADIGEVT